MERDRTKVLVFLPSNSPGMGWFARKDQLEYKEKIYNAIAAAEGKTVAEFRQLLPPGEFESLHQWVSNGGACVYFNGKTYEFTDTWPAEQLPPTGEPPWESEVHADAPFVQDEVLHAGPGDYPTFLKPEQDYYLPEGFGSRYGGTADSALNGSWWEFPVDKLDAMKTDLEGAGFSVSIDLDPEAEWKYYG